MKRKSAWLSFAACALTAAAPCPSVHASRPAANHAGIQVIAYPDGQTGFFEKETGTLYVYDASLRNCVAVRRISKLGANLREGAATESTVSRETT